MLDTYTSGVAAVNIDNGFFAAVTATLINRKAPVSSYRASRRRVYVIPSAAEESVHFSRFLRSATLCVAPVEMTKTPHSILRGNLGTPYLFLFLFWPGALTCEGHVQGTVLRAHSTSEYLLTPYIGISQACNSPIICFGHWTRVLPSLIVNIIAWQKRQCDTKKPGPPQWPLRGVLRGTLSSALLHLGFRALCSPVKVQGSGATCLGL
jgi:hypothetical protein